MSDANLLTLWSELLAGALAESGVREVVVSPGSRSTPFVLALARTKGLRLHTVIDERAAAFFALGIARASGRAPLLVCTSGTAPAHYLPAVIEASESALPLLVLSADRPHRLASCGAPQTTEQARLFGVHARAFVELGEPTGSAAAFRALRRTIARAVAEAHGPLPGPVHVNARADKPLEPERARTESERALEALARAIAAEPVPRASLGRLAHDEEALELAAEAIADAARPAIVAGPLGLAALADRGAIFELARSCGLALFAEAASQLRFAGAARAGIACADAFDRWIDRAPPEAAPDVVIEIGATPTSAAYARWIDRARPARFVLGGTRYRDPSGSARAVVLGPLGAIAAALLARTPPRAIDPHFADAIAEREARAWSGLERALAELPGLHEAAVARALALALPAGALLALGNSLPIRHVDRCVPGTADLRVLSQRGVNGIDGAVSAVAGAATIDGAPAALLAGDVTFAHDVGGLALAARVETPLVLVVLDNAGGRIFEQLPLARAGLDEAELALFTTPPRIDIESAAAAFGIRYESVDDGDALAGVLRDACRRGGATLVHARVPPGGAAMLEERLARAEP